MTRPDAEAGGARAASTSTGVAGIASTSTGVTSSAASGPGLFDPLDIGGVRVRNRLMQAAHSRLYAIDGEDSDRDAAYFVRRAEGGVGLLVAGNRFVHPSSRIEGFPDGWRRDTIAAGRRLTDAVHAAGAAILVQLNHHGAQASPAGPDGPRPVVSASRIVSPSTGAATIAATPADLDALAAGWADSAEIALESGYDGIEVHIAHGYLLHQFLSPLTNHRTDAYGGSLSARVRYPLEVLRRVRSRVGDEAVVGIRIVVDDVAEGGLTDQDVLAVIELLRAEVRVDFLDLGAGGYHNPHYVFPPATLGSDWMRAQVGAVKARNPDVAVFGVGAARSVEDAEEVVRTGLADMVALTRAQIADPDLAVKLRDGHVGDITHCIKLNQGCLGRGANGLPVACTVNPLAGRESIRSSPPGVAGPQRWVVIGGGPAGMRAAADLARGGHEVTLLEAEEELGGQLRLAATVPGRATLPQLIADLARDVARAGVDVRLATPASEDLLASLAPDGVVVATGARMPSAASPSVGESSSGDSSALSLSSALSSSPDTAIDAATSLAHGAAVTGSDGSVPLIDAWTALREPRWHGRRVVIVDDDGTNHAAGVVLALRDRGAEVTVVTTFDRLLPHAAQGYDRALLLERFHTGGAGHDAVYGDSLAAIVDHAVEVTHRWSGSSRRLPPTDVVVWSTPRASVHLELDLTNIGEVVTIGDARAPRGIDDAIFEAFEHAFVVGRVVG